jgi:hypothetical protein
MGCDNRLGRARWKMNWAGKMKRKSGVADGLQGNTGRIEMGRERKNIIVFTIFLIQGNGIQIKSFEYFQTNFEHDSK